jgi:hypothetical protein
MTVWCSDRFFGFINHTVSVNLTYPNWRHVGCYYTPTSWALIAVDGEYYNKSRYLASPSGFATVAMVGYGTPGAQPQMTTFVGVLRNIAANYSVTDEQRDAVLRTGVDARSLASLPIALPLTESTGTPLNMGRDGLGFVGTAVVYFGDHPAWQTCASDPSTTCPDAYSGYNCDQPNACLSSPCSGGQTCSKRDGGYVCM